MKFIDTLKNVWKITELKDRIILTLGLLLVYRFGAPLSVIFSPSHIAKIQPVTKMITDEK